MTHLIDTFLMLLSPRRPSRGSSPAAPSRVLLWSAATVIVSVPPGRFTASAASAG